MFQTGEAVLGSMLHHPRKCPLGRSRGLLEEEGKIFSTIARTMHSIIKGLRISSITTRMTINRTTIVEARADAFKVDGPSAEVVGIRVVVLKDKRDSPETRGAEDEEVAITTITITVVDVINCTPNCISL